jgi:hypothetical protein
VRKRSVFARVLVFSPVRMKDHWRARESAAMKEGTEGRDGVDGSNESEI